MKKIVLSGIGLGGTDVVKALESMPELRSFVGVSKSAARKKKKRQRELARRQKRFDNMNK